MKLSKVKDIIREESAAVLKESKKPITEGIIDSIVSAIVDKIVKTRYKKYFAELHKDPEYQETLKRTKQAAAAIDAAASRYEKQSENSKKVYDEYVKKYGKEAADKIVSRVKSGEYRLSWKK